MSLHGRRECLVWRMTSIWGAEHGSLSTKLHFPAWVVSIKKVDNLWKRRWMIFAFKETILSRFVTIKEVVSVSKKPISYPSRKLYKEDMKLSKLNGTSQSILINFFVTMDRPAGWLHHKSVAIREAKKTKHCEFFWHSPHRHHPNSISLHQKYLHHKLKWESDRTDFNVVPINWRSGNNCQ